MKKKFPALTGLRFIAAMLVFFHHNDYKEKEGLLYQFTSELHIGVTLFFVLSGFLITYNYFDYEKLNIKRFFINRFARIYPIYFALTTITFFIYFHKKMYSLFFILQLYFCNITFIRGFSDKYKFSGIGPGWSLTVEEMFYILSPIIFFLIRKNINYRFTLPFIILFLGFIINSVFSVLNISWLINSNLFLLDFTFFGRSFEFFAGIGLAIFVLNNKKVLKPKLITYFGVFMLFLSVCILVLINDYDCNKDRFWSIIFNNYAIPILAVTPLLYGLLFEKTFLRTFLENNIIQLLGKSSYVFYLIHTGFIYLYINDIVENRFAQFIMLNLISIMIYLYFEKPVNNYIRKKYNGG